MFNENVKNRKNEFSCLKYTHLASSIIIIVFGVIFFISSIHIWIKYYYHNGLLNQFINIPIFTILAGSIVAIIIGWIGVIVVWQNTKKGIITFYISTCLLLMFNIVGWVYLYYSLDSLKQIVLDSLLDTFYNYSYNKISIDELQSQLHCCGIYGLDDWFRLLNYIPGSCCNADKSCDHILKIDQIYEKGCFYTLEGLIDYYTFGLLIVLVMAEGSLILSITLSFILYKKLQKRNENTDFNFRNEITYPRSNNPLGHPLAPEHNQVPSNVLHRENNESIDHDDTNAMHNFWTPVVQEHTNHRFVS